jgi:protein-S-isoprenylcysteine O-methyltransferase Ste14
MDEGKSFTDNKEKSVKISVIKIFLKILLALVIQALILFVSAGHTDIPRAWIYIFINFIFTVVIAGILLKYSPEVVYHRSKWRGKRGTKSWDKVLLPAFIIIGWIFMLVIIGLDVGRFRWSLLTIEFAVLGFVFYLVSTIIVTWAMITNKYFEATVRIQKDRGHRVVSTGPYIFIRHPGYIGGILGEISIPLIIGSFYGLIPAVIAIILLIIRTSLEDKTLHNELDGYSEYAKRVKYKLIPGIW